MHKPYKRIVNGANTAVLFVHGILETPDHFTEFVSLVQNDVSVWNLLLDGHGKSARDFAKTSMQTWEQQVAQAVTELAQTHRRILIVAHSMGCLLSIAQAVENEKVQGLFLLAAPMKLALKPKMFRNSLRCYTGRFDPDDEEMAALVRCYGVTGTKNPFVYIAWIPRFLELFRSIRKTRTLIGNISVRCEVYQSARDEMVSRKAGEILAKNKRIRVNELENSQHFYYEKFDMQRLLDGFREFISS